MEVEALLIFSTPVFFGFLVALALSKNKVVFMRRNDKGRLNLLLFVVLPIFFYGLFLVGFRSENAGNDTPRYVATFMNLDGIATARTIGTQYYGNTELLLWPFQSLLQPIFSVQGWLVANYCLVFFLAYIYYRGVTKSLGASSAIFALAFLTFFLVYTGNTMRQVLAIPIGALGFHLFRQGNFARAFLVLTIAIGFHWSAVMLLLAPIFSLNIFRRDRVYFLIPMVVLLLSTVMSEVMGILVSVANIAAFTDRYDLYFSDSHVSHIDYVWKTVNFWICAITSMLFLVLCRPSDYKSRSLHQYTVLFISLVFFGIQNSDFSERYMPYILLVLPLQMAMLVGKLPAPVFVKNVVFLGYFLFLGIFVFFAKSSQLTLGYSI